MRPPQQPLDQRSKAIPPLLAERMRRPDYELHLLELVKRTGVRVRVRHLRKQDLVGLFESCSMDNSVRDVASRSYPFQLQLECKGAEEATRRQRRQDKREGVPASRERAVLVQEQGEGLESRVSLDRRRYMQTRKKRIRI